LCGIKVFQNVHTFL